MEMYVLSATGARPASTYTCPLVFEPEVAVKQEHWCRTLFAAIDAKRTEEFLLFLAADATFRFGSAPPATGRADIAQVVEAFFRSVDSLSHRCIDVWSPVPEILICRGEATYVRLDGRQVAVPFCNVFRLRDGKIVNYDIYLDPAPLAAG